MYDDVVTSVKLKIIGEQINIFSFTVGLHQGSALKTHLLALVRDDLTTHIQDVVLWYLLAYRSYYFNL